MPQAQDSGQTSDEEVVLRIHETKSAPEIRKATVPRRISSESLIKGERRSILVKKLVAWPAKPTRMAKELKWQALGKLEYFPWLGLKPSQRTRLPPPFLLPQFISLTTLTLTNMSIIKIKESQHSLF